MAVYVTAVFLCSMDDGSGHDYASDSEYLSLSAVLLLFNAIFKLFSFLIQTNESIFKCWPREKAKI